MSPVLQCGRVYQLAIEEFAAEDARRVISAICKLYSGVLLLSIKVLRLLSPPDSNHSLIKKTKKAVKDQDERVRLIGNGSRQIPSSTIRSWKGAP